MLHNCHWISPQTCRNQFSQVYQYLMQKIARSRAHSAIVAAGRRPRPGPRENPSPYKQVAKIRPWSGLIRPNDEGLDKVRHWSPRNLRLPLAGRGVGEIPRPRASASLSRRRTARAHKFTLANDSKAFAAPLRNFSRPLLSDRPQSGLRRSKDGNGRLAICIEPQRSPKAPESETNLSETSYFVSPLVSD